MTMNNILTFFGQDGLMHIICSALIMGVIGHFLPLWLAAVITLVIGLLKELVWDKMMKKGTLEAKDVLCDVIGILIGLI